MDYMPIKCVKTVGSSARSHKVDSIEVLSFLSSLAGSRPGGCFKYVLLEFQGMAWDGGLWKVGGRRMRQSLCGA
jgi:hypothetical protein